MASPTVVQEKHNYASANTVSVVLDSAPTEGNDLYAWVTDHTGSGPTVNAPDGGWTLVPDSATGGASTPDGAWYHKVAGAAESATVSVTVTGSASLGLQVYEVNGGGSHTDAVTATGSGSGVASGTVAAPDDSLVIVGFCISGTATSGSYSDSFTDAIAANVRIQSGYKAVASAANVSTTFTNGVSNTKVSSIFAAYPTPPASTTLDHYVVTAGGLVGPCPGYVVTS